MTPQDQRSRRLLRQLAAAPATRERHPSPPLADQLGRPRTPIDRHHRPDPTPLDT